MDRLYKYFIGLILLAVFAFNPLNANAEISTWQKGFTLRLNNQTESEVDVALQEMKDVGINYFALSPGWLTSTNYSSNVDRKYGTSSDEILIYTINKAHSLEMKVLLKPHLDIATGEWRAAIDPHNKAEFFENYSQMILHYAQIAEANQVEQFSVGAELVKLTINPDNTSYWKALVADVREIYSGELTYSANADDYLPLDEVGKLTFWEDLDYMGLSFYRPLSSDRTPTVESIKSEWEEFERDYIYPRYSEIQKPLLFTEIGYRSIDGASIRPWDFTISNTVDTKEQADLYQAFFEYWNNKDYVKGVNFWEWDVGKDINPLTNTSYTPQLKPAEEIVRQYFLGEEIPEQPVETEILVSHIETYKFEKLTKGAQLYSDRSYKIESVPEALNNETFTQVKNSDKYLNADSDVIKFDLLKDGFIYVAYDERASKLPNWLDTFEDTKLKVFTSDTNFNLYQKAYSAGSINLGGNSASPAKGAGSNYFVIASENSLLQIDEAPSEEVIEDVEEEIPVEDEVVETPQESGSIIIENPKNNETMNGEKKLKVYMREFELNEYTATYSVDGKNEVNMRNDATDRYKQSKIDFDEWNWNGEGPYELVIRTKDLDGNLIDEAELTLFVDD